MLGVWYKSVNFGAVQTLGSTCVESRLKTVRKKCQCLSGHAECLVHICQLWCCKDAGQYLCEIATEDCSERAKTS